MIDFDFSKNCCGCRACADSCPKQCIGFEVNKFGWAVPKVDRSRCVECGLCERICPFLSYEKPHDVSPQLFSAYAKDSKIREDGSSGSIFYLLAKKVFCRHGVVYGAMFNDNLKLEHHYAESLDEIAPLMKSKYVQSDTSGVYKSVKRHLKEGRLVMFVGTPCQCAALYQSLNKKLPQNLLLVDFICHGVPGQELFDKSIAEYERQKGRKVVKFNFRHKTAGNLHGYSLEYLDLKDGRSGVETGNSGQFPYYCGYLKYYTFRDACYSCKYLGKNRISDITLGDFWFLDRIRTINDFNKGYSMLILNSDKGREYFNNISQTEAIVTEQFPIEIAEKLNHAYIHSTHMSIVHRFFKRDYGRLPWHKLERRYFLPKAPFFQKCLRYLIYKSGI